MESRNIVTAREMVYEGNWIIPTMNGELRLEKPPLPTWIAAVVESVSPDNMGMQRAMAGITATLLAFLLYFWGGRLTGNRQYGLISALILCTSFNFILMGRTATWDIYCHAFMLGAIYCLFGAFEGKGSQYGRFIGAGILMGLSFLSKGPVSFYALLLPFLIAYLLIYRPSARKKGKAILVMILLMIVVSGWWYALIYGLYPDVAEYVLNKESSSWVNRNVRPWHYYKTFFLETGVWSFMLLTALAVPYWRNRIKYNKEYLLMVFWLVFQLILLSLLPEKKTRYLLPILIPSALLIGHLFIYWIQQLKERRLSANDKMIYRINTLLIGIAACAIPVAFCFIYKQIPFSLWLLIPGCLVFALFAFLILMYGWRIKPLAFIWAVTGLFISIEVIGMRPLAPLFNNPDMKSIAAIRQVEEAWSLPFYHNGEDDLRIEIVYAAHKKITPIDPTDQEALMQAAPLVLLTQGNIAEIIPDSIREKFDINSIDQYDNNRWKPGHKLHSSIFVHDVNILRLKEQTR
ncbi:MAG: glycosyltransferase family 39 protein [Bacteroides sp.]|nr:glycosyltransferase family 39 protein [Bacteroides sp.]